MYPARFPQDRGSRLKFGYDSHFNDDHRDGLRNSQWVFFHSSQILLVYLTSLKELKLINGMLEKMKKCIQSQVIDILLEYNEEMMLL